MNLPNKLTILRIILTVVFLFFLFAHSLMFKVFAFFTFIVAAFTDFLDGRIARKYDLISDFGRFMDPIADKILILSAFLALVEMGLVPAWMVVIIIARECVITGLRIAALRKQKLIEASLTGKHKTAFQLFTIIIILAFIIFKEIGHRLEFWTSNFQYYYEMSIFCLMLVTVFLTIVSGISIFLRNKEVLYEK
ncbi:MAG: CDP-diacylglycerol--glycerol-3-phosphate 3-phosphatidyltransferase [Candidatus Omnitrophica bacterium]|nr:CDP-diacylglycerol--glycerol-3-phosphate 3-phosphatidyltransferase [Candidatus Omnitrophota bacterium]